MARLDTTALECFLAVAETGSFTHGANCVSRTQSAVSQQITKLEEQLGYKLFIRQKDLMLTSEGEILLSYAKKIMRLNREAIDRFQQPALQGQVRFGVPEDFASVFLSDVLMEYASLHPRISLNVECDLTVNLYERFKKNDFDLVLVKMSRPENLSSSVDVWSETLVWVGDKFLLQSVTGKSVPLVLSPQPCVYRARAIEALEKNNQRWDFVFTSDSYAGKLAAVKAGMGITVLPRSMVPADMTSLNESEILPTLDDTHVSLLKHNEGNEAVNSFERFVIKHVQH